MLYVQHSGLEQLKGGNNGEITAAKAAILCTNRLLLCWMTGAYMPEYAHFGWDAGADLKSPVDVMIPANGSAVIDTGVHIDIPQGYAGFLKSKSGLNVKHDLTNEGVIDAGYTGSICVKLYNHGKTDYKVHSGDKISQIVFIRWNLSTLPCNKLPERERGNAGFGSTGK